MPGKLQKTIKCDRIKENLWLFESSPCRVRKMRKLYRKRNLPTGTEWRSLPKKPSQQGIPSVDSFLRLSRARQSAVKKSESCLHERALFYSGLCGEATQRDEAKRNRAAPGGVPVVTCLHERALFSDGLCGEATQRDEAKRNRAAPGGVPVVTCLHERARVPPSSHTQKGKG